MCKYINIGLIALKLCIEKALTKNRLSICILNMQIIDKRLKSTMTEANSEIVSSAVKFPLQQQFLQLNPTLNLSVAKLYMKLVAIGRKVLNTLFFHQRLQKRNQPFSFSMRSARSLPLLSQSIKNYTVSEGNGTREHLLLSTKICFLL